MVGLALYCYVLFYPQQRTEFRIFADALQLSLHNVLYILFHLIIVELYGGFHLRLVGCVILEIGYQRNRLITRVRDKNLMIFNQSKDIEYWAAFQGRLIYLYRLVLLIPEDKLPA